MNASKTNRRSWVSPITAVSFVIVAVTGIMMLFHVHFRGLGGVHQWIGVLFCSIGVYHVVLNWRPLLNYIRGTMGIVAVALVIVLSAILIAAPHGDEEGHGGHPGGNGPHPHPVLR